ncbi:hypothetical protein JOF56_005335 [Kibdelosporangium banguiense]|uniref:Uncharacterized protein n=1 Tax=Kibdelosporangium banguiense TaxID=1365924 RepID=A0ABS4TLW1_9PSEU|nr:hypothetical protein [Kibdelosporangium banguiense]MBP2324950.1 hypothetical protein [Kibdelosporangium banguiense]
MNTVQKTLVGLVVAAGATGAIIGSSQATAAPNAAPAPLPEHTAVADAAANSATTAGSLSVTQFFGFNNGMAWYTLSNLPVSAGQAVAVSAVECTGVGNENFDSDAVYTVHNVAVGNGVVKVKANIAYQNKQGICLHYVG